MEEEVLLYWNSTATLHEMGMPPEPSRCYLLIKEKADGTQPKRLQEEETEEQPTGQPTKKVRDNEIIVVTCTDRCYYSSMCVRVERERKRERGGGGKRERVDASILC